LSGIGARVDSPRDGEEWSGIVAFRIEGKDPLRLVRAARQQGVAMAARGGRLRASPHFYNDSSDVARAVEVLASLP
jgi:selenocysteine lyase/cysteine desulfurase